MDKAEMVEADVERSVPKHVLQDIQKHENQGIEFSLEGLGIKQLNHFTVIMRHEGHVSVQEELTRKQNRYGTKMWGRNWRNDDTHQVWPAVVNKMLQRDKLLACVKRFNAVIGDVDFSKFEDGDEINLRDEMKKQFFPDLPVDDKMNDEEISAAYDNSGFLTILLDIFAVIQEKFRAAVDTVELINPTEKPYIVYLGSTS